MHSLLTEFMALFEGHESSFGTYVLTGELTEAGKHKGKAQSLAKPVEHKDYDLHLTGKRGLGIIPINKSSMVKFAALDIDDYKMDVLHLANRVAKMKLPLITCRTKSGGAHLYLFLRDWAPADLVIRKMREMSVALGFGTCEIYPRQAKLLSERGDAGNWINIPYFDETKTTRYAYEPETGKALSLAHFLNYVREHLIDPVKLHNMKFTAAEHLAGGPPCLQQLCAQGFPDGTRNNGLVNLGVYAQKAYGDKWESKLEDLNRDFMKPPLDNTEVLGVIKSLKKKTYTYTCKAQPIQSFCNAAVCRTCAHGIGGAELGMPKMGTLTKLESVPPVWFLDVETATGIGRLELTTDELQYPLSYQKRCMEALNIMPIVLKRDTWSGIIAKLLEEVNCVPVQSEITPIGILMNHLESFCTSRVQAQKCDELLIGKPWHNNNEIHFRLGDFLTYLDTKKFKLLDLSKVASVLTKIPGYRKHFHNIKGKGINVAVIPGTAFDVQTEPLDVPAQPKEIL